MKHSFIYFISQLAVLTLFFSCQKAPELILTGPSSIELNADGSNSSITFTANRDWRVSSSDAWVTLSPSSGTASEGPVTVSVRCNANTTYDDRTATVTISMEELSQTVTVRQPANLGVVLPSQTFDIQANARSLEVEVQANVEYSVEISENWVKQTGTKGLTSRKLAFSVEENKTYDPREAKITIKPKQAGVAEKVITVRQAQIDALIVEKTSYDMPYGGGEIEIKVEANVAFNVTPGSDWLHHISTKALSNSAVVIKVDENATYSAREGKIEIAQQNGSIKHSITVKQAGRIAVTSIELDKASLSLKPEETAILIATVKPDNATDKTIIWSSSDSEIVSVDDTGTVTAVKDGSAIITAQAGEKSAICNVTVTASVYFGNAVDLGIYLARDGTLYKLLWADCNLGTDTPEGYGDYYAWGETETKADYTWSSYLWGKEWNKMTKYCPTDKASYWDGDGSPDGKKVLDPVDDVAHEKLGGKWRMPTRAEQDALRSQCIWTWTTRNGVNGYEIKSTVNSNSIFLPVAGYRCDKILYNVDVTGMYWSSTHDTVNPWCAYVISLPSPGIITWGTCIRFYGLPVRPVIEEEIPVASVAINMTDISLLVGDTVTLNVTVTPDNATDKNLTWTSSDTSIVSVDADGKVTAIKEGTATITAKAGEKSADCFLVVSNSAPDGAVNLGIVMTRDNGTKYALFWAECNIGANKEEDHGDYYAWGEIETKDNFSWETYMFRTSGDHLDNLKFSKYNSLDSYGPIDNKTVLDPEDDVAHVKLGGKWRIPTRAEQDALRSQCVWTWTKKNGANGYEVKSKVNMNSIFLPAAGDLPGFGIFGVNGSYWSSSLSSSGPDCAYDTFFNSDYLDWASAGRYLGLSVRPVTE